MSAPALNFSRFDPTVRVNDDLFVHVNGTWMATTPIPEDKTSIGAFEDLREASQDAIRTVCENLSHRDDLDPDSEEAKIARLYRSFSNEERIEEVGTRPLTPLLERIAAINSVEDLRAWWGWCLGEGLSSILDIDVDSDPGNPNRYLLFVGQDGLGLPDESYYREPQHKDVREKYKHHLAATLAHGRGGHEPSLADLSDAEAIFTLEVAIAACHWDIVRTRDIEQMYNLQTREEMVADAESFGWDAILTAAGLADRITEAVNCQPSFFTDVAALLTPERLTAWRAWATYHLITDLSPFLPETFTSLRFGFYGTVLTGQPVNRPRWKRAVGFTEASMGEALGKIYVATHYPPQAAARMETLVANLLAAYRESIANLDWMSDTTKAEALKKLDKFRPKIGHPAKWRDFSGLKVTEDLMENVLASGRFELAYELSKLGKPVDGDEWLMYPQEVNAYYHPLRNEIVFPAAILQPPFFNADADDAVNYGAIGAVIGHEIGHGFDDQGASCDGDGMLRDWWTPQDHERFEERTKALIAQYDALSPRQTPTLNVNGALTIGENIGDIGGLGIAIKAWKMAGGESAPPIDGYTGIQRLFLSWAACWSYLTRDELVATLLATDPHSPAEIRCNQVVRNLDEFHEAFAVTPGDPEYLAPSERVTIW